MKIVVASKNPVKIETARRGFSKMFPDVELEVVGLPAPSNVPDQPMNFDQTYEGAYNRAINVKAKASDADYYVGIEGGIEEVNTEMFAGAWIVVIDKNNRLGKSCTARFVLPNKVAELIRQGEELGTADDIVFKRENSKQQNGAVGILTNDVIDRTSFYETAVVMALIPFVNEELY